MTVQNDIQRALSEVEDARMRRRAIAVSYGVPGIALLIALVGFLISAGAVQKQADRAEKDLQVQMSVNTELRTADSELRETVARQHLILTEISVNLQSLLERQGMQYKRADNGLRDNR